jgi:hypothetical protein
VGHLGEADLLLQVAPQQALELPSACRPAGAERRQALARRLGGRWLSSMSQKRRERLTTGRRQYSVAARVRERRPLPAEDDPSSAIQDPDRRSAGSARTLGDVPGPLPVGRPAELERTPARSKNPSGHDSGCHHCHALDRRKGEPQCADLKRSLLPTLVPLTPALPAHLPTRS